jgi:hypothetical protein
MWDTVVGGLLVIAGGLVALGGNYWIEMRRWKREDKYRDYAERHQVYVDFIADWFSYEDRVNLPQANPEEVNEAWTQLLRSFNALSLLAPDEVRAAAVSVREGKSGGPGRFWKAARKDLGKLPPS